MHIGIGSGQSIVKICGNKYLHAFMPSLSSTKSHLVNRKLLPAWKRALISGSAWPDKDEFLDVIYWGRQIVSLLCGVICGILPLTGFIGILTFAIFNMGSVFLFFSQYHKIDEQEYGGPWEITKEGFMTSFASFMVTWIIIYTALFKE